MKIAIVGAGKLGLKVTNALTGGDHSITIIDQNEAIINRISQQYDVMTVVGNAKQVSLLRRSAIGTFDFLIACTDSDEKNMIIASFAKKIGCSKVIARVRDPEHMNQIDIAKSLGISQQTVAGTIKRSIEIMKKNANQ